MVARFEKEKDLAQLIRTQYVFIETSPGSSENKAFIEHYKLKIEGIPHIVIVSAKGEMVDEAKGAPQGEGLNKLLMAGIEKTGGMKKIASATKKPGAKITKLEPEELESVLKQVSEAKEQLESEDTILEGMISLVGLNRTYTKIKDVTKEILPLFTQWNKDKAQAALFAQARILDSAAAAVEQKKSKQAVTTYKSVIKKYPDSSAATYAQSKLDELEGGEKAADTKPAADAQTSTKKDSE
jgi:hypothetical protein